MGKTGLRPQKRRQTGDRDTTQTLQCPSDQPPDPVPTPPTGLQARHSPPPDREPSYPLPTPLPAGADTRARRPLARCPHSACSPPFRVTQEAPEGQSVGRQAWSNFCNFQTGPGTSRGHSSAQVSP